MKHLTLSLFIGTLLLIACAPTTPTTPSPHGGGHAQTSQAEKRNLTVQDQGTDNEVAFSVQEGANVFSAYGVSHTKEMHLIVVRNDLQHFQHIHPERDAAGVWRIPSGEYLSSL